MESYMLIGLKKRNPDREYPTQLGQKWTDIEEKQLLDELSQNIDKPIISINHSRTIGGIDARIRLIAYNMFANDISIDEIVDKTKLTKDYILEIIQKTNQKNNEDSSNKKGRKPKDDNKKFNIENEIIEIKEQLKTLNTNIENICKILQTFEV